MIPDGWIGRFLLDAPFNSPPNRLDDCETFVEFKTLASLGTHDDLPTQPDAQSQLEHTSQGPHPKSPPRPLTQGTRQRPSPKHPTKRGPPTPQKSPAPQAIRQRAQRETPDHHKKQREGITFSATGNPRTTSRTICSHQHLPDIPTNNTTTHENQLRP